MQRGTVVAIGWRADEPLTPTPRRVVAATAEAATTSAQRSFVAGSTRSCRSAVQSLSTPRRRARHTQQGPRPQHSRARQLRRIISRVRGNSARCPRDSSTSPHRTPKSIRQVDRVHADGTQGTTSSTRDADGANPYPSSQAHHPANVYGRGTIVPSLRSFGGWPWRGCGRRTIQAGSPRVCHQAEPLIHRY